jgi:hypothetical protein
MRKLLYFTLVSAFILIAASCGNKPKSRIDETIDFRSSLTEADTVQMLKLCDDCMELLKNKDIDGALAMLNEYVDSTNTVQPLTDITRAKYNRIFNMFPVLEYKLSGYSFVLEGLNDVKYTIKFAEEEHPEKNGEPKTSFMFNPVKIDGQWYLTVKRPDQESTL